MIEPFSISLAKRGIELVRDDTTTLQVNVGLLCNQSCRHCHLEAGPDRIDQMMSRQTMKEVSEYARRGGFHTVDITGGAPEMHPLLPVFVQEVAAIAPRVILRSNLTALGDEERRHLIQICREHRVAIIASFPSLNSGQTESLRGKGIFERSIQTLRLLNESGYGLIDTGLELDLVSNPSGAFLPSSQGQAERKFQEVLSTQYGISFNHLYLLANVPLGRFRKWLIASENFDRYMEKLVGSFNACAITGLMCRSLVSVSWDGTLYDCDFNLASGVPLGGRKIHVSSMKAPPATGSPIATSDYCYTCTAGSGFT
jgi:radical SAM/Cys-rich protein